MPLIPESLIQLNESETYAPIPKVLGMM